MISVIIPAYNVEPYLGEALESVLAQTCAGLEVIIVDDGSTDATPQIAARYAAADGRVRVITQPNAGLGAARNTGLDAAAGEWIAFLDSDDALHPRFLSLLLEAQRETGSAIVSAPHIRFGAGEPFSDISAASAEAARRLEAWERRGRRVVTLRADEAARRMLHQTGPADCSAWGKLFRRELFEGRRFRPLLYEDLDLIPEIYLEAARRGWSVAALPTPLHYYRQRHGSLLHVFDARRLDVLGITARLERDLASRGEPLARAAADRRFAACCNMLLLMHAAGDPFPGRSDECWREVCRLRLLSLFGRGTRARNRLGALLSLFGRRIFLAAGRK